MQTTKIDTNPLSNLHRLGRRSGMAESGANMVEYVLRNGNKLANGFSIGARLN
jgi:hypothetical protein